MSTSGRRAGRHSAAEGAGPGVNTERLPAGPVSAVRRGVTAALLGCLLLLPGIGYTTVSGGTAVAVVAPASSDTGPAASEVGAPATRAEGAEAAGQEDLRPPRGRPRTWLAPELTAEVRQCLGAQLDQLKGTVLERSFDSRALGKVMRYVIYLPPGYDATGPGYPVLYMLHGRGGARTEWLSSGLFVSIDRGIDTGKTTPMIVVVPEGQTGYWTDHSGSGPRWGQYIVNDLVGQIDGTYATQRRPTSRAIGGESMGGWGALHLAFSHPEVFRIVGAHSPSLRPDDGSLDFLGRGSEFAAKDPMALARKVDSSTGLRIWLDTAVDDPWASRATMLDKILTERGIAHSWQLNPGGHNWKYWQSHLADYIDFYSRSFRELANSS